MVMICKEAGSLSEVCPLESTSPEEVTETFEKISSSMTWSKALPCGAAVCHLWWGCGWSSAFWTER